MTQIIRLLFLLGAASFVSASLTHSGKFITGCGYLQANIAGGVIAFVLIFGLTLSFVHSASTRWIGLSALGLARLGALIGLIIIGIFSMPIVIALNLLTKFLSTIADRDR